ncbi:hypothetical protein JTB14_037266 [Gonioctena quinquepunctata]|nr:hypothetical protein JTB14_037266 [Gonioctena quinquepunctata]
MSSKKRLTVQDVADMFESEQFWADFENDGIERVYIEPPDDKEESDEDSGDESGGLLDNLAGRQLASSAEMVLQSGKRFGFEEDDENFTIIENNGNPPDQDYDEEDDLPLARKHSPSVMQLQFRKEIAQIYLKKNQNLAKTGGRPSTYSANSRVTPGIRYDRIDHIIEYVPNNKRRRCAGNHMPSSAVRTQYLKCNVGLCINCFGDYHKEH